MTQNHVAIHSVLRYPVGWTQDWSIYAEYFQQTPTETEAVRPGAHVCELCFLFLLLILDSQLKNKQLNSLVSHSSQFFTDKVNKSEATVRKDSTDQLQNCTFLSARRRDLEHLKCPPILDTSASSKLRRVSSNVSATTAFHLWIVTKQDTIISILLVRWLKRRGDAVAHSIKRINCARPLNESVPLQLCTFKQQSPKCRMCCATSALHKPETFIKLRFMGAVTERWWCHFFTQFH